MKSSDYNSSYEPFRVHHHSMTKLMSRAVKSVEPEVDSEMVVAFTVSRKQAPPTQLRD